ncbi:MAG: PaaI family thioesterase [Fidelibacterota bacterium]|nr:MAG: PaaI family thioesterase [Candidatus Neomarinimicrobiota bacterium]
MTSNVSESHFPIPENYLSKHLGFNTASPEPGHTEVELDVHQIHLNITGVVHGGFLMTVLDTLMGHAVFTHLGNPQARFGTTQMTTHFLRPVHGGELRGAGKVISEGKDFLTAEAELRDERGQLIATAEAQFTHIQTGLKNSET